MARILVVDDMPICRQLIAGILTREGHEVATAEDGMQALLLLSEQTWDLMLLDLKMPRIDGFAVLRAIQRSPRLRGLPVIVLSEISQRSTVVDVARIGAHAYLLKGHFEVDQLLARVDACLSAPPPDSVTASVACSGPVRTSKAPPTRTAVAATKEPPSTSRAWIRTLDQQDRADRDWRPDPLMTQDELQEMLDNALNIPPFGPTAQQIMAVTASAQCTVEEIANVIAIDQAISIRLLKLANSSAYTRGRSITSVRDAVQRIGVREIRALVMSLAVIDQYEAHGADCAFHDARMFWEHSIACGVAATQIAAALNIAAKENYLIWGLLHDVGRVILLEHCPEKLSAAWDAARELGVPLEVVEPKLLLLDHTGILEQALERWHFAAEIITPVVSHHLSVRKLAELPKGMDQAAATIVLANSLVSALGIGSSGNDAIYPLQPLVDMLQLSPDAVMEVVDRVDAETRELRQVMLAHAQHSDWPDSLERWRSILPREVNILTLASVAVDPFKLFLGRLGVLDKDGVAPTGAVLYGSNASDMATLMSQLAAHEANHDLPPIPVVMISDTGKLDPDPGTERSRTLMCMPLRYDQFLNALADLHVFQQATPSGVVTSTAS